MLTYACCASLVRLCYTLKGYGVELTNPQACLAVLVAGQRSQASFGAIGAVNVLAYDPSEDCCPATGSDGPCCAAELGPRRGSTSSSGFCLCRLWCLAGSINRSIDRTIDLLTIFPRAVQVPQRPPDGAQCFWREMGYVLIHRGVPRPGVCVGRLGARRNVDVRARFSTAHSGLFAESGFK